MDPNKEKLYSANLTNLLKLRTETYAKDTMETAINQ